MRYSLLIVTALVAAGCTSERSEQSAAGAPSPTPSNPPAIPSVWTLDTIAGETPASGARFQLKMGADGRISGRSGCNNFAAGYALKGTTFTVQPPMMGTKMLCPEEVMAQEATFRAVMEAATTAAVGADGRLTVTGGDGRTLRFAGASEDTAMPMPVPSHIVMRCAAEQLRVRLVDGQAEVTLDDGSATMLPRLAGETGATETYTNGRMTLERQTSPQHGFRFARGRMALMPCMLAQN